MAASLGPSWSLRSNASPRCLTAYVTKTKGNADGTSNNTAVASSVVSGSVGGDSSNPFDDEISTVHSQHGGGGAHENANASGCVYSVAFGTERGSLHYRTYPSTAMLDSDDRSRDAGGGGSYGYGGNRRSGYHRERDPSQLFIDPEPSPNGQVNLQGAVKGSIVGIVRARPSGGDESSDAVAPVFLLLVDDNRGSSSASQSSNPGAYAAHLVTIRHGSFSKLPAAPPEDGGVGATTTPDNRPPLSSSLSHHRRGGSHASGGGGSSGGGGWFGGGGEGGGGGGNAAAPNGGGNAAASAASLGALPRVSCATYHPDAGFVYAAGTGVYGLPAPAMQAVLAGMVAHATGITSGRGGGGPFHHSANASVSSSSHHLSRQRHALASGGHGSVHLANTATAPPVALYPKCGLALPLPGARCSSGGGGGSNNSMALACRGRVAIVAVSNAFYAVPCCLDVDALRSRAGAGAVSPRHPGPRPHGATRPSQPPSVAAAKLLTFAQSSQVHPVIAVEVVTSDDAPTAGAGPSDVVARCLRPITSLLFLASGRECATLEIVSVPDARAVDALGKGFGVAGGGGMVPTSVKCSAPRHGVATVSSPIVAAASLPPTGATRIGGGNNSGGGDLSSGPLVALLTADGLVHVRSPSCVAVPLASIEVGTRPNDFFTLSPLPSPQRHAVVVGRNVVATSYGGEARTVSVRPETAQDFADRLIKLSIDAFGSNGFPRVELAEALGATFSATSYAGPEPNARKRSLLKQYLESVLGLADGRGGGLARPSSPTATEGGAGGIGGAGNISFVISEDGREAGLEVEGGRLPLVEDGKEGSEPRGEGATNAAPSSSLGANSLLTCTALLCLVCYQLKPAPDGAAACRASKACASAMGVVRGTGPISKAAVAVCELVADRLLKEVSTSFSLLTGTMPLSSSAHPVASGHHRPSPGSASMEFVESAVWLLRSCGCHEKAIDVLQERMNSPAFRNASVGGGGNASSPSGGAGSWSQIKFDSYLATHLGELWSSGDDRCCQLVLHSPATRELVSRNPTLGLSVFTTVHPQNELEWKRMKPSDDPLAHPSYPQKVVKLLKSVAPHQGKITYEIGMAESFSSFSPTSGNVTGSLPIDSGRALAVSYLESAIGIATGRPASQSSSRDTGSSPSSSFHPGSSSSRDEVDERKADMHDELSYLLLEGVISERGDADRGEDSDLGGVYRLKLRRLLSWPNSRVRSERLLGSLPASFLREHALLLGRLGRHEDALCILYTQENSLELALEYCDVRHERQQAWFEESKGDCAGGHKMKLANECAYIPLVKVALSSDPDSDRGTAAAIQVLALRRDSIDKSAALRLLPKNIPMSAVVRPFLIPAVVENESQVRRLSVASSLLRSRYIQLKQKLTEAQLKSQATLHGALALKNLNLGDVNLSSKPTKARPVHAASPNYPDVMLVKHFFPRHLVIQAQVTNNNAAANSGANQGSARTLADVAFVIAESSDEALVPTEELPLKTVPPGATGSVWCILAASPQRLDGAAFLTCELRFTVLEVDAATGTPLNFSEGSNVATGFGRTYVEELQDIEVRHTEFG